jgi:anti-sigma factor RsiW
MRACQTIAIELPGYADGKLDPSTTATVRKHLESCAACTAEVHQLGRLSSLLAAGLPPIEPSRTFASTFAGRLAAEVAAEANHSGEAESRWRWLSWILQPWLVPLAAAAMLGAIMYAPWFTGDHATKGLPAPALPGVAGGMVSAEKPPADIRVAAASPGKSLLAAGDLPPDLARRADLFVDYGVIRDLDLLESNGEAAGGHAG